MNEHTYHHLTTLLHQPVVGHRNYQDLSVPLKELLPEPVQFVRGRVQRISCDEHTVDIRSRDGVRSLRYDKLVVALGWEPQFYNIPGLEEHALTLRNLNQSRLAHNRIEEAFIAYDDQPDQPWRTSIVVGGGGLALGEKGAPLPPTAQLAVEQGECVARSLRAMVEGGIPLTYQPHPKGIVLPVGRRYALGVILGHHLSGMVAGMLKDLIAYRYLSSIGGPLLAFKNFFRWHPLTAAMREGA